MLKKKFFAKAFAFAMVSGLLTVAAPAAIQAWATSTTPTPTATPTPTPAEAQPVGAEVQYDGFSVVLTPGEDAEGNGDDYVFLEVMKTANDTKQGTVYPYPCSGGGEVTVDLSFLKITKPTYLRVWGDKSQTKVTLTVSAQPAKIKYKYAAQTFPVLEEAASDATDADKKKVADANQAKLIEYYSKSFGITDTSLSYMVRSLYGGTYFELCDHGTAGDDGKYVYDGKWDFGNYGAKMGDMLANVKVTGTTLIIYQAATENTYKEDAQGNETTEIDKAGAPAGAEVKVKIPAAPKAPKVTVDYVKGTIKLPKNAQYGIIKDGEIEYVTLANGGAVAPEDVLKNIADALKIVDDDKAENEADKTAKTDFIATNLADGFNLVVRTNDPKKGVSNPTFVTVKGTVSYDDDKWGKITRTTKDKDNKDVVTEIATYEFTDEGAKVTFASGSFEYEEAGKWKKIKSGTVIKGKTTELTIRQAGTKEDKNDPSKAAFPSTKLVLKKSEDKSAATIDLPSGVTASEIDLKNADKTLVLTATPTKDRDGATVAVTDVKSVEWKSSDESIATVAASTAAGKEAEATVTGKKVGKVTITAVITLKDDTKVVAVTREIEVKDTTPAPTATPTPQG